MDKLAPILIDNAEEWEAEHILDPSVHYRARWGGFSLARPCPYMRPGGVFFV